MSTDPLDSAIPVGSGPGQTVPPATPVPPPAPPAAASAPRAAPAGSDKVWAILSHLSSLFGVGLLLPLIVYVAMKGDSAYVADNSKEALNFHLSLFIYALCCIPLIFIVVGIPLLVIIGIAGFILSIVGAVKASEGSCYRYPLTLRLVK